MAYIPKLNRLTRDVYPNVQLCLFFPLTRHKVYYTGQIVCFEMSYFFLTETPSHGCDNVPTISFKILYLLLIELN